MKYRVRVLEHREYNVEVEAKNRQQAEIRACSCVHNEAVQPNEEDVYPDFVEVEIDGEWRMCEKERG